MHSKGSRILAISCPILALLGVLLLSEGASLGVAASLKPATSPLEQLLQQASAKGIAHDKTWQSLLFYAPSWLHNRKSLIDDPRFFLSATGDHDPQAELAATLAQLFNTQDLEPDQQAYCRFPRRFKYLQKQLNWQRLVPQPGHCPVLTKFLNDNRFDNASLVFTAYYPDNPASTFGHSFVRLHRRHGAHEIRSDLLDAIINFSAMMDPADDPLSYTLKGISGGYVGKFFFVPYFEKIQEYNNRESRDLWEYGLALDDDHINSLLLSLWEVANREVNYYYFDDNCSYLILALLNTVAEEDLLASRWSWNTPADTLRILVRSQLFNTKVTYRASAKTRFDRHFEALSQAEQRLLPKVIASTEPLVVLEALPQGAQARIIDAGLEYVDFYNSKDAQDGQQLAVERRRLLAARSTIVASPMTTFAPDASRRPDLGHETSRIGTGGFWGSQGSGVALEWLPSLHELGAPELGYPKGMEIKFLHLAALIPLRQEADTKQLGYPKLRAIAPLRVLSAAPDRDILKPVAWQFETLIERLAACGESPCTIGHANYGWGRSFSLWPGAFVYGLGVLQSGVTALNPRLPYVGPGITVGLQGQVAGIKLVSAGSVIRPNNISDYLARLNFGINLAADENRQARLAYDWQRQGRNLTLRSWQLVGQWYL